MPFFKVEKCLFSRKSALFLGKVPFCLRKIAFFGEEKKWAFFRWKVPFFKVEKCLFLSLKSAVFFLKSVLFFEKKAFLFAFFPLKSAQFFSLKSAPFLWKVRLFFEKKRLLREEICFWPFLHWKVPYFFVWKVPYF